MSDSACFICGETFLPMSESKEIFYCPSTNPEGYSHYHKVLMTSALFNDGEYKDRIGQVTHLISIDPFAINWFSNGDLTVYNLNINSPPILQEQNVPYDQLPKIYQRFKNLRPFL